MERARERGRPKPEQNVMIWKGRLQGFFEGVCLRTLLIFSLVLVCCCGDTSRVLYEDNFETLFADASDILDVADKHKETLLTPDLQDTSDIEDDQNGSLNTFLVSSVSPNHGPVDGLSPVSIFGDGFKEGLEVFFGDAKAMHPFVLSPKIVNCTTPPHAPGLVRVRVVLPDGRSAELQDAYLYESPLALSSVFPNSGPMTGGTPVTVKGSGFSSKPLFLFGGKLAITVQIVDDNTALMVTPPHGEGRVSLVAVAGEKRARLSSAFEYIVADEPPVLSGVLVTSCEPSNGPASGGTAITVYGKGFSIGANLRIGALPATDVQVIGPTEIRAKTPPGSPGPVDVVVYQKGGMARLEGGFEYDGGEMKILAIEPDVAAWSGGAWVRLYGTSLKGVEHVFFGAKETSSFDVKSSVLIVARVPRSDDIGVVPVTVFGKGAAAGISAFTYYDPGLKGGGTWGGAIEGALNVTVYNGQTGKALPDAYVIIGNDEHTAYQGRTDDRGQVTLSDPGLTLKGPVVVHGVKEGFSAATVAGFDATNVSFYIGPPPAPDSGEPLPIGPDDVCILRGRVRDFGKYFLKPKEIDGIVEVRCDTSASSMFGKSQSFTKATDDRGRFELNVAPGEYAVICKLMVFAYQGDPNPVSLKLGAARHIKCSKPKEVIEGIEIGLDFPTDAELWLATGQLPFWPDGVNGPSVLGAWELGTDGYLEVTRYPLKVSPERVRVARVPREYVGPISGYGYSFYTTVSAAKTSNGLPYAVTLVSKLMPAQEWPFLKGGLEGISEVPTKIYRPITAMISTKEEAVVAADLGGGVYLFDGEELFLAPFQAPVPIYGLFGNSIEEFFAVGAGGRLWHIEGPKVETYHTGVPQDLISISGESATDLDVASATTLWRFDGKAFYVEPSVQGVEIRAIRRFDSGKRVVVGTRGALAFGDVGAPLNVTFPTDADLNGLDGPSNDDLWIAGAKGTLVRVDASGVNVIQAPTARDLHGVLYRAPCDVFAYGDEGTIIHYDCDKFVLLSRPDLQVDLLAGALLTKTLVFAGRRYVSLPSFVEFPVFSYPVEGSLWDSRRIAWSVNNDNGLSYQTLNLSDGSQNQFWTVMAGPDTRDIMFPNFKKIIGYTPVPEGLIRLNITVVRTPGFSIDRYTSSDTGFYRREAFAVNLATAYASGQ